MNRLRILHLLLFITYIDIYYVKCELKDGSKSKKLLPYFRRKVEEQLEDADFFETTVPDDPRNLVSFLVKNVREIFDDLVENAEYTPTMILTETTTLPTKNASIDTPTIEPTRTISQVLFTPIDFSVPEANISSIISTSTYAYTDVAMLVEHLSLTTLLDKKQESTENLGINTRNSLQLSKDIKKDAKTDKKERDIPGSIQPFLAGIINTTDPDSETSDPRRSCIMCDNVASEDCNDPKNKLIPSIMCERDDDLCYSLHTPFGIVDRGCFNVNHNLTTYVCSCNLCNHISISEMPFMFSNKRDWTDNVIELSRTRHFRKSVFKDMSCLRCEVNTTTKTGDMLDSANCLEGNIGNLPVEDCDDDEVCAVRALRADGYIWRGCIKTPLYNYWWSVCDYDLCNYDTIVTLYNFIV